MADPRVKIVIEAEDKSRGTFDSAAGNLNAFGKTATSVGKGLSLGLTAPLLALGGLAFKAGSELNAGMADVASLSIASERVTELKSNVQDMQIQFGKSAEDLTSGLYQVISAFGDSADAAKELDLAVKAGVAGRASTSEALALISAETKGYGDTSLAAQQKVADLGLKTVELGKTTLPELASSIGMVTSMSAQLGISQEELHAGASALSGVIGTTSQVFTGQRGVMQSLLAPTDSMTSLMAALNYKNGEAMVKGLGWSKTLQVITTAAKASGMPLQSFIGSIEGQNYALALTGAQLQKYTSDLDALGNSTGKTDAAYAAQTQGVNKLAFTFEQGKQKIQVFLEKLSDGAGPALLAFADLVTPMGDKLLGLADAFSKLDPSTQKWIVGLAAGAAALGPLLFGLGALSTALGSALPVLGTMAGALAALVSPLGLVAVGLGALAYYNFDSIKEFGSVALANIVAAAPNAGAALGEIVAQLTGIGLESYDTTEGIQAFVTALTGSQAVGESVATWVFNAGTAIAGFQVTLASVGTTLSTTFAGPLALLQDSFSTFGASLGTLSPQFAALGTAIGGLWASAQPALTALGQLIAVSFGASVIVSLNFLSATFQNLGAIIGAVVGEITAVINLLSTTISGMTTIVSSLLTGNFTGAWTGAQTVIGGFSTFVLTTLGNLSTVVSAMFSTIGTTISTSLNSFGFSALATQVDAVQTKIQNFATAVKGVLGGQTSLFGGAGAMFPAPTWLTALTSWTAATPSWLATMIVWTAKDPEWLASMINWTAKIPDWLSSMIGWVAKQPDWLSVLVGWIPMTPEWIATLTSWVPATPAWLSSLLNWSPTISISGATGVVGNAASSAYDYVTSLLPHKASGDSSFAGGVTSLGERGWELLQYPNGQWAQVGVNGPTAANLPAGTRIYSHEDAIKMMGGAGITPLSMNAAGTTKAPVSGDNAIAAAMAWGSKTAGKSLEDSAKKAGRIAEAAAQKASDTLKAGLQSTPGLFHTSQVTQQQMDLAELGVPQNFADDWIRHLTDEVVNGVQWSDADIKDAATRAGIDPSLPAKAILDMVTQKWNDSSLFADKKNLNLINVDAVKKNLADQAAAQAGQANIMAMFGIKPDQVQAQAAAVGAQWSAGIAQGAVTASTGTDGKAGTSILGSIAGGMTPEAFASMAGQLSSGLLAAIGDDKSTANADLAAIGPALLGKISDSWANVTGIDLISKLASAINLQLGTDSAIQTLKDIGGKIFKIVFEGWDLAASGADYVSPMASASSKATKKDPLIPGNATGTTNWRGGLTWVGENGPELVNLSRGSQVFSNQRSMAMAGAGTVNNYYTTTVQATVDNTIDIQELAYRVAGIIQRKASR